jgi:CRISPR-associated protein Cas5h
MDSVLVFDVWGEYGHFRKYYTTTSPLTFAVPPRTALTGLIAGIIGLEKNEYLKHFSKQNAHIAVKILSPTKKVRFSENLIDTKTADLMGRIKNRTQIRFEFLKNPKFRIYFHHTDAALFRKTREFLEQHKCVYIPCLGLSEHIANFNFVGELGCTEVKENTVSVPINSVIPLPDAFTVKIDFKEPGEYFSEILPVEMDVNRTLLEYCKTLYERNGKPIQATVETFWKLENNENIIFL